jgi:nitrogen fixation/metabolism regulation signal transduction histidine kinase
MGTGLGLAIVRHIIKRQTPDNNIKITIRGCSFHLSAALVIALISEISGNLTLQQKKRRL